MVNPNKPKPEFQVQLTERDTFLAESTLVAVEKLVERMFPPEPFKRSFFSLDSASNPELGSHICDDCPSRSTCREGWACDAYNKFSSLGLGLDVSALYSRRPVFDIDDIGEPGYLRPNPLSPAFSDWTRDEAAGVIYAFATEGAAVAGEILSRPPQRQRLGISPEAPVRKVRADSMPVDTCRILNLHREGLNPSAICKELGLPKKAVSRVLAGDMNVLIRRPRTQSLDDWRNLKAQGLTAAEIARQEGNHPAEAKKPRARNIKSTGPEISKRLRETIAELRGQTVEELDLSLGWMEYRRGKPKRRDYPVEEWRELVSRGFSHLALGEEYRLHASLIQKKLSGTR
jgi:hypothetical protein